MNRAEEVVISAILVAFIAVLGLAAVAAHLWPLWIPVAMLIYALMIHTGLAS